MKITHQQPTIEITKPNRLIKKIEWKKPPTLKKPRDPKTFITQAPNWKQTTYKKALIGPYTTNWKVVIKKLNYIQYTRIGHQY